MIHILLKEIISIKIKCSINQLLSLCYSLKYNVSDEVLVILSFLDKITGMSDLYKSYMNNNNKERFYQEEFINLHGNNYSDYFHMDIILLQK